MNDHVNAVCSNTFLISMAISNSTCNSIRLSIFKVLDHEHSFHIALDVLEPFWILI